VVLAAAELMELLMPDALSREAMSIKTAMLLLVAVPPRVGRRR